MFAYKDICTCSYLLSQVTSLKTRDLKAQKMKWSNIRLTWGWPSRSVLFVTSMAIAVVSHPLSPGDGMGTENDWKDYIQEHFFLTKIQRLWRVAQPWTVWAGHCDLGTVDNLLTSARRDFEASEARIWQPLPQYFWHQLAVNGLPGRVPAPSQEGGISSSVFNMSWREGWT